MDNHLVPEPIALLTFEQKDMCAGVDLRFSMKLIHFVKTNKYNKNKKKK
jgi:hypothetical protein